MLSLRLAPVLKIACANNSMCKLALFVMIDFSLWYSESWWRGWEHQCYWTWWRGEPLYQTHLNEHIFFGVNFDAPSDGNAVLHQILLWLSCSRWMRAARWASCPSKSFRLRLEKCCRELMHPNPASWRPGLRWTPGTEAGFIRLNSVYSCSLFLSVELQHFARGHWTKNSCVCFFKLTLPAAFVPACSFIYFRSYFSTFFFKKPQTGMKWHRGPTVRRVAQSLRKRSVGFEPIMIFVSITGDPWSV